MRGERGRVMRMRYDPASGENVLVHLPVEVYVYRDASGRCLYVGQTFAPEARHHNHRSKSPWISEAVERLVLGTFDTRGEALDAEAKAIRELAPAYNILHNSRRVA